MICPIEINKKAASEEERVSEVRRMKKRALCVRASPSLPSQACFKDISTIEKTQEDMPHSRRFG